ncbi:MAG: type II secretion system GspH family protein, partial [Muribaculaceae bacterium]|nr:type II secretion system GspH family protein [Muribaculaceae bacterium]
SEGEARKNPADNLKSWIASVVNSFAMTTLLQDYLIPRPWWERGRERGQKAAFTLAEVLITLGIIGVVAAMTIPGLIQNNKATRLRSQFLKSYSTIQQAFRQMEADNVSLDPTTYARRSNPFYNTFKQYFKGATDCAQGSTKDSPCYNWVKHPSSYKTLNGERALPDSFFDDFQFVLPDGTFVHIDEPYLASGGPGWVWVMVDINGYNNPPNRAGYDLFVFEFKEGELRTMGSPGTVCNVDCTDMNKFCSLTSTELRNGFACAHKAKTDTDYFKWVVKNVK